jgi:hypothetical protein
MPVLKWQSKKLYETNHSANGPVIICNSKQGYYNDRKNYKMMALNEIRQLSSNAVGAVKTLSRALPVIFIHISLVQILCIPDYCPFCENIILEKKLCAIHSMLLMYCKPIFIDVYFIS